MTSFRKLIVSTLIVLALFIGYAGTQGCVKADTDNLLDPSNFGWPAWFIFGAGSCRFNVNKFNDPCVML